MKRVRGAVLLEVLLAMTIFVMTAMVVLNSLSMCARAVREIRLEARANDMAVSLLSEIQMGLVQPQNIGPNPYEEKDLADWTWQVSVKPVEDVTVEGPAMQQVEAIIFNTPENYSFKLVQLMPVDQNDQAVGSPSAGGGQ